MASAFESFVQQELPKRGYLNTDVGQETIIVRRGVGPRQFDAVSLVEGQALAMVGGVLQGVSLSSYGIKKVILPISPASSEWIVAHNFDSENVIVQCFDETKSVIIPDSIQIIDSNTIKILFNSAISGVVRVMFLD